MTYSPMDDAARRATAATITAKRDAILAERAELIEKRTEILTRLRRLDRELADCRAAARLFELEIEFPPDEREEAERQMRLEMERRERERALGAATFRIHGTPLAGPPPSVPRPSVAPAPPVAPGPAVAPAPPVAPVPPGPRPVINRPTVREFVLAQLKAAAPAGMKSATLRDLYERGFGNIVHEKTVGMTLYRLLTDDHLVRREGHVWFLASPRSAEAKNPGGSTPGSHRSPKVEMKGG
jgi:hypothetical protein